MIKLIGRISVNRLSGSVKLVTGENLLHSKEVTPTAEEQIVKPDPGYDGLSDVKVVGEQNLTDGNIKYGVSVFGVMGTYMGEEPKVHELDVTPTGEDFTEYPYSGFAGISKVNVEGDENLTPDNVKKGVEIYGVTGEFETPTTPITVTPTGYEFTETPEEGEAFDSVTVEGDDNLIPENIKKDVTVYGVTGTLEGGIMPDTESIPTAYEAYVASAKELYTGEYSGLMILDSGVNTIAVCFLMPDFAITNYNQGSTWFSMIGAVYCQYRINENEWSLLDYRTEASTGEHYTRNIQYCTRILYYYGKQVWPFNNGANFIYAKGAAFTGLVHDTVQIIYEMEG